MFNITLKDNRQIGRMDTMAETVAADTFFYVKDCALAPIATGIQAQNLNEFRDRIAIIHPGCIFFHFWGSRLRTSIESVEFNNDFSFWSHNFLHDDTLAERLEILDPTEYQDIEKLRHEILEIIDNRLDELEYIPWARREHKFHFIRSRIVVFNTPYKIEQPSELIKILPLMSRSSIFYHFIDARRRTPNGEDDFTSWLKVLPQNYDNLIFQLKKVDPFFISLSALQHKLTDIFSEFFLGKQDIIKK